KVVEFPSQQLAIEGALKSDAVEIRMLLGKALQSDQLIDRQSVVHRLRLFLDDARFESDISEIFEEEQTVLKVLLVEHRDARTSLRQVALHIDKGQLGGGPGGNLLRRHRVVAELHDHERMWYSPCDLDPVISTERGPPRQCDESRCAFFARNILRCKKN